VDEVFGPHSRKGVKAGQGKAKLVLVLPAPLITQLRAHRKQQAAERLVAGSAWQGLGLGLRDPHRSSHRFPLRLGQLA
jgi:hypothetical protein